MNKIVIEKTLIEELKILRKQKKKIVTYNGSFDVLHLGHVRSIQEAKNQGDVLVLIVNSDASIKKYKGPLRPILPEKERIGILEELSSVDYVVLFDDINPKRILSKIKPDIHCNGGDWGKDCIEREVVESNGGKVYVLKWEKGLSTTNVILKITEVYKKPNVKAVFIDRDGTINHNKDGYIYKIEDFEFLPGVLKGLKKLSTTDYKIIITTNQSGIGRGYYTQADFDKLTEWMLAQFNDQKIRIDHIYHCPHHPDEKCDCRKPNIGMFLDAVKDFDISLNDSYFIGDTDSDVQAGREANLKTIKIGGKVSKKLKLEPKHYAKDFQEAIDYILS